MRGQATRAEWAEVNNQSGWMLDKKPFNKLYKPPPLAYLIQCAEKSYANVRYWQIQQEVVGDCSHT